MNLTLIVMMKFLAGAGQAAVVSGDGKILLSAGLYGPTGAVTTLGKIGKP